MRKYFIALASLATLFLLASCAKEQNVVTPEGVPSGEIITISASFPATKVTLEQDDSDYDAKVNLAWAAGDQITVTDASNPSNTSVFTLASGAGSTKATFTGTALAAASSFNISYDGIGAADYNSQSQAADASTGHLKYAATLSGVNSYGSFTFSQEWATANGGGTFASSSVLRLRAQIPDELFTNIGAVRFKADANIFNGNDYLIVNLDDSADEEELGVLTVYANLPAVDQAIPAGTKLLVQFKEGSWYDLHTAYRELPAMTLQGGKVNALNLNCDNILSYANADNTGIGGSSNPYLIGDQTQLNKMHEELSSSEKKYFKLVDDIDMTGVAWVSLNNASGYDKEIDFDGQGHTITSLNCSTGAYPSFAGVAYGSYKDVTFDYATINGGSNNMGVFAGYIGTVVSEVNRNASCSGITVSNSTVTANATQTNRNAGGFAGVVGVPGVTITNCHVVGTTVSQEGTTFYKGCSVAGFIGNVSNPSTITGCTAQADVHNNLSYYTGGFIGQIGAAVAVNVTNCAFLGGNLTANRPDGDSNSPVAGFVGRVTTNAGASFTNCYVDGAHITALHSGRCGGFIGDGGTGATPNTFTSCYVKNSSVSGAQHCGGFAGTLYGVASKCYVENTTITANNNNVGGFAGYLENGTATNCSASATVVGGSYQNIGGFVGNCRLGADVPAQVTYCYANSTVSGSHASVGAFIGGVTVVPDSVTKCIANNGSLTFIGSDGGLDISTAIVDNFVGTSGIIAQAGTYGWDTGIWDLTGSEPKLK